MSGHTSPHTHYRDVPEAASSAVGPAALANEQLKSTEAQAESTGAREVTLEKILGTIKAEEDRFWLRITPLTRKHNRKLAVSLTVWAEEAIRIPDYLLRKFTGAKIDIAENAKTRERALYSAVVRLGSSSAAVDEVGDSLRPDHISRTAHTMAGVAEYCKMNKIPIIFGNESLIRESIKDLSDIKLRALADAAIQPGLTDNNPTDEEAGPADGHPIRDEGLGKLERCETIDSTSVATSEDDRSGGTEARSDHQAAAGVRSPSAATSGCDANAHAAVSTTAVGVAVKKHLPLFGILPYLFSKESEPPSLMLLVAFSDKGTNGISLYGPIKSGAFAEKTILAFLTSHT